MVPRRSPCEYYLKYLLVHPDNYSLEQVREIVKSQQLDFIGEPYAKKLLAAIGARPIPYYPSDVGHRRSQRFLIRLGIRSMFVPDSDVKLSDNFLSQPQAKELIETCTISGMSSDWIAGLLRRDGFQSTSRAVDMYCHFYWNMKLLDSSELKTVLFTRSVDGDASKDNDVRALSAMAVKSSYSDPRCIAADTNVPIVNTMMTLIRKGLMPSNMEIRRLANATRTAAIAQTLGQTNVGGKGAERARDFATVANLMHQIVSDVGDVEEEMREDLASIKLDTDASEVPHIKQLSDGNHTVSVEPLGETDVERETSGHSGE